MIELRAQADSFGVGFIIHERGIPFDPEAMERQAASVGDDLSERGLGLKLMKTFMDEFAFTSLVIAVCAVIANAEGWEDIECFGITREKWLKIFLELPNGIPSHDTFARVFARLEPIELQQALSSWLSALQIEMRGKVVAFDGKTVRLPWNTLLKTCCGMSQ